MLFRSKPKNILIEAKSGEPYLIDFGLSLTDVHINTDYGGSLAYKSPEQARGPGALIDGRSDLYSLGNVFYKMLTGRRPFDDKNQKELLKLIADVHRETVPASDLEPNIPPELNRICMRLLRKKKWERYQDGAELARDLDDWLEGKIKDRIQLQTKVIPHGLRSF